MTLSPMSNTTIQYNLIKVTFFILFLQFFSLASEETSSNTPINRRHNNWIYNTRNPDRRLGIKTLYLCHLKARFSAEAHSENYAQTLIFNLKSTRHFVKLCGANHRYYYVDRTPLVLIDFSCLVK